VINFKRIATFLLIWVIMRIGTDIAAHMWLMDRKLITFLVLIYTFGPAVYLGRIWIKEGLL